MWLLRGNNFLHKVEGIFFCVFEILVSNFVMLLFSTQAQSVTKIEKQGLFEVGRMILRRHCEFVTESCHKQTRSAVCFLLTR